MSNSETLIPVGNFNFKNVQLFKKETLGTGSYGAVYKAMCDQLICAAKLLYPFLQTQTHDSGREHRQPLRRFELECEFLSRVNHPNIVQYLGTYRDPETSSLVLLMELMDESLTHFLKSSPGDIPYHLQVNIANDIAQALAFLHANGIIHRDLSSNNVLLIAGSRAKVSDFGMSKFTNLDSTQLASMTQCPGTPVYMSPEALDEPPLYTEKLDVFSFGVILVQIMTREFPAPSNRYEIEMIPSRQNPKDLIEAKIPISEVTRRQAHIDLIDPAHVLLSIAFDCLKNKPSERPSSEDVCQSLAFTKLTSKYKESLPQDLRSLVKAKDKQLEEMKLTLEAKDEIIETNLKALKEKIEQLEASLFVSTQKNESLKVEKQALQDRIDNQESQLAKLRNKTDKESSLLATPPLKLKDSSGEYHRGRSPIRRARPRHQSPRRSPSREPSPDIPSRGQFKRLHSSDKTHPRRKLRDSIEIAHQKFPSCLNPIAFKYRDYMSFESLDFSSDNLHAGSSAIIDDIVYFTAGTETIHKFTYSTNQWIDLPDCPCTEYTIVSVDDVLTTVGGMLKSWRGIPKYSNKLLCLSKKKWIEPFPPMKTCRSFPGVVFASPYLVVMGGFNLTDGTLTSVEMLNTIDKQWSSVASLPFKASQLSAIISNNIIYIHPGYTPSEHNAKSVVQCSLPLLVLSNPNSVAWESITSLEVSKSSIIMVHSHLLAVGGEKLDGECTDEVYLYETDSNTWVCVGAMYFNRCKCLTAFLPNNKLMVVGGETDCEEEIVAEVATFKRLSYTS